MNQRLSFPQLVARIESDDEQAADQLVRDFEPVVRGELRFQLRDARSRLQSDSMDICQSLLANFFVRVWICAARALDAPRVQRAIANRLGAVAKTRLDEFQRCRPGRGAFVNHSE